MSQTSKSGIDSRSSESLDVDSAGLAGFFLADDETALGGSAGGYWHSRERVWHRWHVGFSSPHYKFHSATGLWIVITLIRRRRHVKHPVSSVPVSRRVLPVRTR